MEHGVRLFWNERRVREQAVPVMRVVRVVQTVRAGAVRAALATTRRCGSEVAGTRRRITRRFPPRPPAPRVTALTSPVTVGRYPRDTGGNGPR